VLGIVITVVSLLVQLTSDRYTGVARMFLRDRTNVAVISYYVITCVVGVFLSLSLHSEFVPRATVLAMMAATGFGIVIMLPYFAYVFRFLAPTNLVASARGAEASAAPPAPGPAILEPGARDRRARGAHRHHVELDLRQGQDHREPRGRCDQGLRRAVHRDQASGAPRLVQDRRWDPR
jgi:hypothetical protein